MSSDAAVVYRIDSISSHPTIGDCEIVSIDGRQCVIRAGTFQVGSLAVLVPPGSTVPPIQPFVPAFKPFNIHSEVVKSRLVGGVSSWGLVVPAPPDAAAGDDVGAMMLVKPPSSACERLTFLKNGEPCPPPSHISWKLKHFEDDLRVLPLPQGFKFASGSWVICVEELDGFPCRVGCVDGLFHVKGEDWVSDSPDCLYWDAIRNSPGVFDYCRANPGDVLHGVVCGAYGDLKYGAAGHEHWFIPHVVRDRAYGWDWRPRDGMAWAPVAYVGRGTDGVRIVSAASGLSGFNYGQCEKKGVYAVEIDSAANCWMKSTEANAYSLANPHIGA